MEKLTEIKLISEGRQLKEFIEGKSSIKELAKVFHITEDSIAQYFKAGQIRNEKFKQQMENYFQESFHNMVKMPVVEQINKKIMSIRDNIRHYDSKADSSIINKAYKYATYYSDLYHQLIAKGNIGIYRYNIGLEYDSSEILKEVIKESSREEINDLVVYYTVRLAFNQYNKSKYESAKIMLEIEHLINDNLEANTLYDYYYFYGVALKRKGKVKEARQYLEKALLYAENTDRKTKVYLNIALCYKKSRSYKLAIEWNNKALDIAVNKELRIAILNNIANVYIKRKQLDRARWFAEQAMDLFEEAHDINRRICVYDTYIEIDPANGLKLMDEIIELLHKSYLLTDNQHVLLEMLEKMISLLKEKEDIDSLKRLFKILYSFCEENKEKRMLYEIKGTALDIILCLNTEGGNIIEKIC